MFSIYSMYFIFLILFVDKINVNGLDPSDIVIVILDQKEGYHMAHAEMLKKNILEQAEALDKDPPKIILSHKLNINGSWTIIPLLNYLLDTYSTSKWFFFCLENTVIRLNKLLSILLKYKENKNIWIGHVLYDQEPTIIHHFAEHKKKLKYPHIASGFGITSNLLANLVHKINEGDRPKDDFSIDASYEFASFVLKVGKGVRLTHVSEICIISNSECATYPRFFHPCGSSVTTENIYFAVKTCSKFHIERIPVIKRTWAKYATNIGYFSDIADKHLPDSFIVPNTTQGHCAKTYSILVQADKILKKKNLNWLIISDDDTIFSVARLLRLLTCYNPNTPVAIGERYGFQLWDSDYGYEYLTGGAGVALSASLVHEIIELGKCECPSSTTPDDMYLFGICLSRIRVQPVHSSMFHQARPSDYATAYLASQEPISFHKFWMIEPQTVYDEWFAEADKSLITVRKHTEL
ncbi:beta-1,3-glucosyltransferase [Bombus vancouverensis nearcticus]|uniref:Beta-1,3-glucosyltransferase n=1 Tax=Bombus bifarius TaxID=103933 RepID=A0A6P8ND32_9HYME|nr:beta-1,3-glucosyltransferase [Bombus vancouverensis nearcticus]XP_033312487.1 beta-1,3-glucosyltransferase [Bombus bifarius]